jgi:hypothetical protein
MLDHQSVVILLDLWRKVSTFTLFSSFLLSGTPREIHSLAANFHKKKS